MFWLIFLPALFVYLAIGVGAAAIALRQFAQVESASTVLVCPTHGRNTPDYCSTRPRCDGITYEPNPDAGKIDSEDMPAALAVGLFWPVASLPALVWWLATRTPTPLAERTRLEEVERRYNEDREKLARSGHDDLDEALTAAESEMGLRAKIEHTQRRLWQRVRG